VLTRLGAVSGDDDERAAAVVRRAPRRMTAEFLGSLDEADRRACGRFGNRMVIIALRTRSAELLADALLANALSGEFDFDWRDAMVSQSVHFVVAVELGVSPVALFDGVADRLPPGRVADRMRSFGRSPNITLAAFGHEWVQTPDGPDLILTGMRGQLWRQAQQPPDSPPAAKGELQALGHKVAGRLGAILARRDVGVAWSGSTVRGVRELANSAGWTRNLWYPDDRLPAELLELPFLVRARFISIPPSGDTIDVTVTLVDPHRMGCSAVRYTGWVHPDWARRATSPADTLAAAASAMVVFTSVAANRGDITTSVSITQGRDPHLVLATGQGNPWPRVATEADFQRLRDLAGQILDALTSR